MSVEQLILNVNKDQGQPSYEKRIDALKNKRFQVDHIERGINEAVDKLQSKVRSFVIYGEPQSGKTEFMIALTCKLIDLNYRTIFVVMNDNTELETQNFDRFHNSIELNPTPMRDFQINQLATDELKVDKQRIIFCRKNSKNLQKLIESCRHMTGRVVIDDEADYATPNTKINKAELTAINDYLGKLGELEEDGEGIYIGVTATPARLDLNNTYLNKSKSWVFLDSHKTYKGRSFFFPVTTDEKSSSDFTLKLLPDEGDDPKLLQEAVFRFINTVALLNLQNKENKAYSMLIHTAGKTNDHEKDQQDVQKIIRILSNQNDKKFKALAEKLLKTANEISDKYKSEFTGLDLAKYVLNNLGKQEVLVINHKNDSANVKRACEPKSIFTFAIGGNIVSRGLTFDSLLLFFFSRNVKGKLQQNTYIQRARMFGTRRYSAYFELCVPKSLFRD